MIQPDDRSPDLYVDLPDLLRRVDTDHELLCELLRIFKEEFPCLLQLPAQPVDATPYNQLI
jgi:hypothetical protein